MERRQEAGALAQGPARHRGRRAPTAACRGPRLPALPARLNMGKSHSRSKARDHETDKVLHCVPTAHQL